MPGFEESENYIYYRVRDPAKFQDDSFRQITLKRDKPRVMATVGKLKGETTTTIQRYMFPKEDGWTVPKARKWVNDHKKSSAIGGLMDNPKCAAQHFGLWSVEPLWLTSAVAAIQSGHWQPEARTSPAGSGGYAVQEDGIAVIPIMGQILKGESSYGGTSSVATRRAIRQAGEDRRVKGILLVVDSPGGTVAGTGELARDVARVRAQKPLYAHVEDLGASAAYWVASQAERITASPTSEIGSIGTMAVVEDSSGAAAMRGIKVHVVATGAHKGDFMPGTEISKDQLDRLEARVEDLNSHFVAAVASGRGVPMATVSEWSTGEVWIAERARQLGLIDKVSTLDDAVAEIVALSRPRRSARSAISRAKIAAAKKQLTIWSEIIES